MTREIKVKKNVLCMAYAAWGELISSIRGPLLLIIQWAGHTRPVISLAALIMKEPGHHITFMCIPFLFDKVHKEFASHFPDKTTEEIGELVTSVHYAANFPHPGAVKPDNSPRIIAVTDNNSEFMIEELIKAYCETLVDAFSKLSIKCGKTGKYYIIPIPTIMFADVSYFRITYQH